jgi:general secretion pathway protein D
MKFRPLSLHKIIPVVVCTVILILYSINVSSQTQPAPELPLQKPDEPKKEAAKPATKTPVKPAAKKQEFFTLNFKDTEISEFANMMGSMIGKNVVIDESIRGKISISSAKKIPIAEAFNVMKTILEVKGLAVIETENLLRILPVRDAIKKNTEVIVDGKKVVKFDSQKTITILIDLQYADAMQINSTLQPLKSPFTDIVVYAPLNTIILSGPSSEIDGLMKIARALDRSIDKIEKKADRGNIHVVALKYASAEDLANVLSRVPFSEVAFINTEDPAVRQAAAAQRVAGQPVPVQAQQQKTKLSIIASKEANALIVTATPNEFTEIMKLIEQLDVVREQVLIEALIVEVSADNSWSFGIDWMGGYEVGGVMMGSSQTFSGSIAGTRKVDGLDQKLALPLNKGFQVGVLLDKSILSYALLNMNQTDSNFNVLSTPQILTVDNNEAELNVGEQIPVQSQSTTGSSGTTQYSYDYKQVGVKLKITPHITSEDIITLDLYQEANEIIGDTTTTSTGTVIPPKLAKRDIKTKISVANSKTIVVGGLIKNSKTVTETKVPILGDIPILGWLFKQRSETIVKKNLLVFITPHLVTKQSQIDAVTQQKLDEQKLLRENK